MIKKCKISFEKIDLTIYLKKSITAREIWKKLPIESTVKTWGKEVYFNFDIDVKVEQDAKSIISYGEIAFWPQGKVIAIGYGRTPISTGNEIRLADDCNIWGLCKTDLKKLDVINQGELVLVTRING